MRVKTIKVPRNSCAIQISMTSRVAARSPVPSRVRPSASKRKPGTQASQRLRRGDRPGLGAKNVSRGENDRQHRRAEYCGEQHLANHPHGIDGEIINDLVALGDDGIKQPG